MSVGLYKCLRFENNKLKFENMDLLQNLGINGKLLLAQIVNFFVLLWVLKKFAYKPVLEVLEERKDKIEKGLKDAEKSQKKLTEIEEKEKKVLKKARQEAQRIIGKAEEQAKKSGEGIIIESKQKVEKLVSDAKKNIREEKQKMLTEVKAEVIDLVALATDKIVGEKINEGKDKEIIESMVNKQ